MQRAQRRKYHYIYKTTCLINNKYYIGMHSTDNLDDGYFGSGKRLLYSIKKHGKENHVCEILEHYSTREDVTRRESEIVNEELLNDAMCMNLQHGGKGFYPGSDVHKRASSNGGKTGAGPKALSRKLKDDEEFRKSFGSKSSKQKLKWYQENDSPWLGRKHSEETKKKMCESQQGKQIGEKNSQFGTCWINNPDTKEVKKVKKELLDSYLDGGWSKGRILTSSTAV